MSHHTVRKSVFIPRINPFARHRRQKSGRATQRLESLEHRTLLASAGLSVDLEVVAEPHEVCEYAPEPTFEVDGNGVVRVGGTHGNDVITAFVGASGLLTVTVNDVTFAVSDSQVSRVEIDAKCGNDIVGVRASVQHPTSVELGHGNDTAYVFGGPARVSGGNGHDLIVTGAYDDKIGGGAGNDILLGGAGNDVIVGGDGLDGIAGGDGNDTIRGGHGADIILGDGPNTWPIPQSSADMSVHTYLSRLANLSFGHDDIEGGDGDDQIYSGQGNDRVHAGDGNDWIFGGTGADWVEAGDGDDIVHGGADSDILFGGAGNDIIVGAAGDDYLIGGSGDDKLSGGDGNDWIFGDATNEYPAGYVDPVQYAKDFGARGTGNDRIHGGWGNDIIFGGGGDDGILADPNAPSPTPTPADPVLIDPATELDAAVVALVDAMAADVDVATPVPIRVPHAAGHDIVFGGAGNDRILGKGGNDIIVGGSGDDTISGGTGHDLILGDGPNTIPRLLPFQVDVSTRVYLQKVSNIGRGNDSISGGAGNDLIYAGHGNDRVHGGAGNDTIFGGAGNDTLFGGDGDDTLLGGAGDDILDGGTGDDRLFGNDGDDTLTGGAGNDYMEGGAGIDEIFAIDGEVDTIKFDLLDLLHIDGIDELIAC